MHISVEGFITLLKMPARLLGVAGPSMQVEAEPEPKTLLSFTLGTREPDGSGVTESCRLSGHPSQLMWGDDRSRLWM